MLGPRIVQLDRRKNQFSRSALSGPEISRQLLAPQLVKFEARKAATGKPPWSVQPETLEGLLSGLLNYDQPISELTPRDLSRLLAGVLSEQTGGWRQNAFPQHGSRPPAPPPALVPRAVDRFFEWVRCPAFSELHPSEQMSITQTRLMEIAPLPVLSDTTVSIFSYLFPIAADYLLPTHGEDEAESFWDALESSWRFSTQELVEFNLRGLERSYDRIASLSL